ncbi:glycosyltransferase family 4 protein [Sphingobacterium suaedae]|uniref:Glycosyltransferase family 4 protein n=1 Tax=Sphingobacterium suaedae TaxID=1686402 RepID=A0ABW5KKR5_9SPHI
MDRKTIVISAVNLVEAGPLAILRECLSYLSLLAGEANYRVVAIVYKKELADYPHIEYIETQWPKKRWINRLWYEYVSLGRISEDLSPVQLWLSLHDTTPSVKAHFRAVYCHNAFSFYRWRFHDLLFAPKIALFALFTKYIYATNIKKNNFLIVQQEWFKKGMSSMFGLDPELIIVSPPQVKPFVHGIIGANNGRSGKYTFLFAGSPNSHKNFEVICRAAAILEKAGVHDFTVRITVKGTENRYAKWLYRHWGHLNTIDFIGFVSRRRLEDLYQESNCLIFPSKVETWGLPISEFASLQKPMLLASLPYAEETAGGSRFVAFFDPDCAEVLASQMRKLVMGDISFLKPVPQPAYNEPTATSWCELFSLLLTGDKSVHSTNKGIYDN